MVAEHGSNAWFEVEWTETDAKAEKEKESSPCALLKPLKCRTVHDVVKTG